VFWAHFDIGAACWFPGCNLTGIQLSSLVSCTYVCFRMTHWSQNRDLFLQCVLSKTTVLPESCWARIYHSFYYCVLAFFLYTLSPQGRHQSMLWPVSTLQPETCSRARKQKAEPWLDLRQLWPLRLATGTGHLHRGNAFVFVFCLLETSQYLGRERGNILLLKFDLINLFFSFFVLDLKLHIFIMSNLFWLTYTL
jgi:hypothetical protein